MAETAAGRALPHRRRAKGAWEAFATTAKAAAGGESPAWPSVLSLVKENTLQLQEVRAELCALLACLDAGGLVRRSIFWERLEELEQGCAKADPVAPAVGEEVLKMPADVAEAQDLYEVLSPHLGNSNLASSTLASSALLREALRNGASPCRWRGPGTPLGAMVQLGRPDLLAVLLQERGDPNARDDKGVSLLHRAAFAGSAEICQTLLLARASAESVDRLGQTPLFFAPDVPTCEVLAEAKAALEVLNSKGQTALHLAARAGLIDVLSWLAPRMKKESLLLRDSHGATPAYYARHAGVPEELLAKRRLCTAPRRPASPACSGTPRSPFNFGGRRSPGSAAQTPGGEGADTSTSPSPDVGREGHRPTAGRHRCGDGSGSPLRAPESPVLSDRPTWVGVRGASPRAGGEGSESAGAKSPTPRPKTSRTSSRDASPGAAGSRTARGAGSPARSSARPAGGVPSGSARPGSPSRRGPGEASGGRSPSASGRRKGPSVGGRAGSVGGAARKKSAPGKKGARGGKPTGEAGFESSADDAVAPEEDSAQPTAEDAAQEEESAEGGEEGGDGDAGEETQDETAEAGEEEAEEEAEEEGEGEGEEEEGEEEAADADGTAEGGESEAVADAADAPP